MDSIAEKIRKLIAKADSTTHAEEADLFMTKAHELLQKHGMSLLDLGRLSEDPVGVDMDSYQHSKAYRWMIRITDAMANYYGIKFVRFERREGITYNLAGRESARITMTLMLPFVQRQVQAWGREAFNKGRYPTRMKAITFIGNAVAARIWQLCRETPSNEGQGINALVPVDLIQAALDEIFSDVKAPRKSILRTDEYAIRKAKELNLNAQAPAPKDARRIAAK